MWMTSCTGKRARGGFQGFWKSQLVELCPASEEDGWLSLARRSQASGLVVGAARDRGGGRWKSQNGKNVYLSPYVEKPLNSKVIKSFVPELRSRVFRVSRSYVLCIYIRTLWTFCVPLWICPFHGVYYGYGIVIGHQVFLSYTNILTNKLDLNRYLLNRVREDIGVMAINGYFTLRRSQEQEPHHYVLFSFRLSWVLLFGLDWFYGISTIVGYLMPNPFLYIYIKYIRFGLD